MQPELVERHEREPAFDLTICDFVWLCPNGASNGPSTPIFFRGTLSRTICTCGLFGCLDYDLGMRHFGQHTGT